MPATIISSKKVLEILKLYQEGMSIPDIERKLDVSKTSIRAKLKKYGVTIVKAKIETKRIANTKQMSEIQKLHEEGVSISKLALIYDVSIPTVSRTLRRMKNPLVIRTLTDDEKLEICKLYKKNFSSGEISEKLLTSETTVRKVLKANNIEIRKQGHGLISGQDEKIIKKYKKGTNMADLSKKYNVSRQIISEMLREHDIEIVNLEKKIDWDREPEVVRFYVDDFLSIREIAEKYDVAHAIIYNILVKHKVEIRRVFRKMTEEDKIEIMNLYRKGISPIKISMKLNISELYIYKVLNENKTTEKKGRGKLSERDRHRIVALSKRGMPVTKIEKKFNISYVTIYKILKTVED